MQSRIKMLLASVTMLFVAPAFAWNAVGHMVVATIAYDNLSPTARNKVDQMVSDFSKEYPSTASFVDMAHWADDLHAQKIESYSHWHYIDQAFSADATPVKKLEDTDNVIYAINTIEPVVKNANANPYERARFLAFLIHFVGNIHQPLHTVSRISAKYPDGDQGGNLYKIQYPAGKTISLHKLWDGGVDVFNTDTSLEHVSSLSHSIEALYPKAYFGSTAEDLNPLDWAGEGFEVAQGFVYATPENTVPSDEYQAKGNELAEKEVALAGYRLANLLNSLLQ